MQERHFLHYLKNPSIMPLGVFLALQKSIFFYVVYGGSKFLPRRVVSVWKGTENQGSEVIVSNRTHLTMDK